MPLKELLQEQVEKLKAGYEAERAFFKKPPDLFAKEKAAIYAIDKVIEESTKKLTDSIDYSVPSPELPRDKLIDRDTIKGYVNSHPVTRAILSIAKIPGNINANKDVDTLNFDTPQLIQYKQTPLPFYFMLTYITMLSKDLFTKTDYIPEYRKNYIKRLTNVTVDAIKSRIKDEANAVANAVDEVTGIPNQILNDLKKIVTTLGTLDDLIAAVFLAAATYYLNRKKLQEKSTGAINRFISENTCGKGEALLEVISEVDGGTASQLTSEDIDNIVNSDTVCEIVDEVLVPHRPFETQLENFSCEIEIEEEQEFPEITESIDLTTKASIQNKSNTRFTPLVGLKSKVDTKTAIASLGNKSLYSPVKGTVINIEKNRIDLKDISDPLDNLLSENIKVFSEKYLELNSIKDFLKKYAIVSLYPIMMTKAPQTMNKPDPSLGLIFGVKDQYNRTLRVYTTSSESFDNNLQNMCGEDNVKTHAENETLEKFKKQYDSKNLEFFNNMKLLYNEAISAASRITPFNSDYIIIDYYYNLSLELILLVNPSDIEKEYRSKISEYAIKRYDKTQYTKVKNKISQLLIQLNLDHDELISRTDKKIVDEKLLSPDVDIYKDNIPPDYFSEMLDLYRSSLEIEEVESYLNKASDENTKLKDWEKEKIVREILFLFDFWLKIDKINEDDAKKLDNKTNVIEEGNWLEAFFANLWKRYNDIPKEIQDIEKLLDNLSAYYPYTSGKIDGEDYRIYYAKSSYASEDGVEYECDLPEEIDSYLNPRSKYGYGNIKYWLKYCAFATLASVFNPITGWSTGLILPVGPIKFPVVYIPIKAIATAYGFLVIGITICGIYPFPWVLFTNYSTDYNLPLFDPIAIIKKEIAALKKAISEQLNKFKKAALKGYLDQIKKDVNQIDLEIDSINELIKIHVENRPPNITGNISEYSEWKEHERVLKNKKIDLKTQKFKLSVKYKIIFNAYTIGKPIGEGNDLQDDALKSLEAQEKLINNQLDKVSSLEAQANKIIAPLPITLQPNTANFGATLKNPTPLIKISKEIDENINYEILDPIIDKFRLNNEDMMSDNYEAKLDKSVMNFEKYKGALLGSMNLIIQKDPFPKYEMLTPKNIPWSLFLVRDWAKVGAKTYGIPGMLPLPI